MKEFFVKRFAHKPVGFYIGLGSAVAMLIANIAFLGADIGDRTFTALTFVMNLVGAAIWIVYAFIDLPLLDFMPILGAACYGVGLGKHLFLTLESLSDVWNGVNFVGGNAMLALAFALAFAICLICAVASCFMRDRA